MKNTLKRFVVFNQQAAAAIGDSANAQLNSVIAHPPDIISERATDIAESEQGNVYMRHKRIDLLIAALHFKWFPPRTPAASP